MEKVQEVVGLLITIGGGILLFFIILSLCIAVPILWIPAIFIAWKIYGAYKKEKMEAASQNVAHSDLIDAPLSEQSSFLWHVTGFYTGLVLARAGLEDGDNKRIQSGLQKIDKHYWEMFDRMESKITSIWDGLSQCDSKVEHIEYAKGFFDIAAMMLKNNNKIDEFLKPLNMCTRDQSIKKMHYIMCVLAGRYIDPVFVADVQ